MTARVTTIGDVAKAHVLKRRWMPSTDPSSQMHNFNRTVYPQKLIDRMSGTGFVDMKWVQVTSGSGGDGGISFARSLVHPMGPPSGGNGGRGGDVYLIGNSDITSLGGLWNRYKATDGAHGGNSNMHGAKGQDIEIHVPVGTVVRQVDSREDVLRRLALENNAVDIVAESSSDDQRRESFDVEDDESSQKTQDLVNLVSQHFKFQTGYEPEDDRLKFLKGRIMTRPPLPPPISLDIVKDGEKHLIARGGRGGDGNPHFVTQAMRGPRVAGRGEAGISFWLELELKTIADAGLVGLPNAGKSTLLAAITNARPKIAPYPFTTLNPYVGTIEFSDFSSVTIADIPGLIQGAHMNVGLGHTFLRHIERALVHVYVIDLSGFDPVNDLRILRSEIEAYKDGLTRTPTMVVANKADIGDAAKKNLEGLVTECGSNVPVVPCSAMTGKNIDVVIEILQQLTTRS